MPSDRFFEPQDEIFHVPQAQRYCAGRFSEWDSKITTFPGLYVVAAAIAALLRALPAALTLEQV